MSSADPPPPLPLHRELIRIVLAGLHATLAATAVYVLCRSMGRGPALTSAGFVFPAACLLWVWCAALLACETGWRRLPSRRARAALALALVPTLAIALVQVGCWSVALVRGLGVQGMPTVLADLLVGNTPGYCLGLYLGSLVPFCALLWLRQWRPRYPTLDWVRYGLLVGAGLGGALVFETVSAALAPSWALRDEQVMAAFLFVPLALALGCHTEAYLSVVLRPSERS